MENGWFWRWTVTHNGCIVSTDITNDHKSLENQDPGPTISNRSNASDWMNRKEIAEDRTAPPRQRCTWCPVGSKYDHVNMQHL